MQEGLLQLWLSTGLANFTWGQIVMIGVGALLIYLAIAKKFEPLLLIPIGFGGILANIPAAGLAASQSRRAARPKPAARNNRSDANPSGPTSSAQRPRRCAGCAASAC